MHLEEYKSSFVKGDRFSRKANPEYVIRNRKVQNYMRSNDKIWKFVRKDSPSVKQADVLPSYKKYDKPNRLAAKLRSKTCELCGQYTNDIEIHQVKRLKSLHGDKEWERLILKNHRQTLAVCPAFHREIHGERLIC